jgi:4-diphosphocytidyl-2-C-methyl-D-erythritol kinase
LEVGAPLSLKVTGPRGAAIGSGRNIVLAAAEAARAADAGLVLGRFRLEKRLPVAAGLGGGSADAAAALRLIAAANPDRVAGLDWTALAASLGADVPVCHFGRPALMTGIGELVRPIGVLPKLWLVLANPGVPLATADVFRALAASPLTRPPRPRTPLPDLGSPAALLSYLRERSNDLEAPAVKLCPLIAEVRMALAGLEGALLARMSGSGPTCFALFARKAAASAGAAALAAREPAWWVRAAALI